VLADISLLKQLYSDLFLLSVAEPVLQTLVSTAVYIVIKDHTTDNNITSLSTLLDRHEQVTSVARAVAKYLQNVVVVVDRH